MSDQGKWFKLHTSILVDGKLGDLSMEDFGRWAMFGAYLKQDGTNGTVSLTSPATRLVQLMRVKDFSELILTLKKFPNCVVGEKQKDDVSPGTFTTVSFSNWSRYQCDLSSDRVRKFRTRETGKKRGEEKRREEMRKEENILPRPQAQKGFARPTPEEVRVYAKSVGLEIDGQHFCDYYEARGWQFKNGQPMKSWKACVGTWKKNKLAQGGVTDAAHDNKSSTYVSDFARRAKEIQGLRKISMPTATGEILAGFRDRKVHEEPPKKPSGE